MYIDYHLKFLISIDFEKDISASSYLFKFIREYPIRF